MTKMNEEYKELRSKASQLERIKKQNDGDKSTIYGYNIRE